MWKTVVEDWQSNTPVDLEVDLVLPGHSFARVRTLLLSLTNQVDTPWPPATSRTTITMLLVPNAPLVLGGYPDGALWGGGKIEATAGDDFMRSQT